MVIKAKGVVVNHASVVWNLAIAWDGMYSSSKAAVKQLSEVLRLELEPLGVRVVTALIAAVDTDIFVNATRDPFEMPPGSYYAPVWQFLVDTREGKMQVKGEPPDVTARHLVKDILGGARGCIWHGETSMVCKWGSWLLPVWVQDILTSGNRGLSELRNYYAKRS